MQLFLDFAKSHPLTVLGLAVSRFFIALLPVASTHVGLFSIVAAFYCKLPVLILLAAAVIRFRTVPFAANMLPEILVIVVWQLGQTLAGPGLRFRAPVDFVYPIVLGVLGAALLKCRKHSDLGMYIPQRAGADGESPAQGMS